MYEGCYNMQRPLGIGVDITLQKRNFDSVKLTLYEGMCKTGYKI